jgi:hypothetical protein
LFACFVAVPITWMSFAFGIRELRRSVLIMLETRIVMSSLIFRLLLILMIHLAFTLMLYLVLPLMLCLGSLMDLTIAHMILVHRENHFEPRRFGGPPPHCGDHFPHRPGFPAGGSHTHFELRHLDSPHFPRRGSCPTRPNGKVQRTMKTSSGYMVKYWIPKIYLTNPTNEPSTSSRPMYWWMEDWRTWG